MLARENPSIEEAQNLLQQYKDAKKELIETLLDAGFVPRAIKDKTLLELREMLSNCWGDAKAEDGANNS